MRLSTLLSTGLAALCLAACSGVTPLPGTPQAFGAACDRSNEGKVISVEGYLRLPNSIENPKNVILGLYRDESFSGTSIGVDMPFGDGVDQVHRITTAYHDSDLQVRLANGVVAPFLTRLRVSGRVTFPPSSATYACILEHPYLESVK